MVPDVKRLKMKNKFWEALSENEIQQSERIVVLGYMNTRVEMCSLKKLLVSLVFLG
jgi:hypothetical protein